jgi:hypothetical protein
MSRRTMKNPPINYAIVVNGVTLTYRDAKTIALDTARYVKTKQPNSKVEVKDLATGEVRPSESSGTVQTI